MKNDETAKRLRLAMGEANISQAELVEKTGISKGSISHYVNGRYVMGNTTAVKIGKILDVNPMWLMGFDCEQKKKSITFHMGMEESLPRVLEYASRLLNLPPEDQAIIISMIESLERKNK